jgi:dihydroflavonol-4-reductase
MAKAIRMGIDRPGLRTPGFELPTWLVRLVGLFDRQIRDNAIELDAVRAVDGARGRQLLGHATIPAADAVIATAASLFAQGLVKA